jgi:hypothetical protein
MNISQLYIFISIAVLLIIAVLVFFIARNQKEKKLTPLAGLAFGFVLAGIVFGEDRIIGYSLMGVGVILSVIEMIRRLRSG